MRQKTYVSPLLTSLAVILTAAVYLPGLFGGFLLDDFTNIVNNPAMQLRGTSIAQILHAIFSFGAGPLMRPISMLTFVLNVMFFGMSPFAFKLGNLLVHLANGVLVFLLLKLIAHAASHSTRRDPDKHVSPLLPLVAGTAWLLHPLNLTPVLYVVQRETSLAGFFTLCGCVAYLWLRSRRLHQDGNLWQIYVATLASLCLGVLSKENAILLPAYLAVLEVFLFGLRQKDGRWDRGLVVYFLMILALPGILGSAWLLTHADTYLNYSGRNFTLAQRLLTELRVVCDYLSWTILPRPEVFGLYHDDIPVSTGLLHPVSTLLSLLSILALAVIAFLTRTHKPLLGLGIAWFFAGHLLESTIFPLELAYEHRNYLPDLGLLISVFALWLPTHESRGSRLRYGLAALAVLSLAAITFHRAWIWGDDMRLARTEAANHPQSFYADYTLGQMYANLAINGRDPADADKAMLPLEQASALPHAGVLPDVTRILVQAQVYGKIDPDVFTDMDRKLDKGPLSASDLIGLESLVQCGNAGNCVFPGDRMGQTLRTALANPDLSKQAGARANILVLYANYLAGRGGDHREVRELLRQAADLVPSEPQYLINLANRDLADGNSIGLAADIGGLKKLNYLGHLDVVIHSLEQRAAKSAPPPEAGN